MDGLSRGTALQGCIGRHMYLLRTYINNVKPRVDFAPTRRSMSKCEEGRGRRESSSSSSCYHNKYDAYYARCNGMGTNMHRFTTPAHLSQLLSSCHMARFNRQFFPNMHTNSGQPCVTCTTSLVHPPPSLLLPLQWLTSLSHSLAYRCVSRPGTSSSLPLFCPSSSSFFMVYQRIR